MLRTAVLRRLVRHGTAAAYTPVIGVECHVQLNTATKAFCRCTHNAHAAPNTHVCGVCLGEPGTLPVHARDAPVLGLKAAVALDCAELADRLWHERTIGPHVRMAFLANDDVKTKQSVDIEG